MVRIAARLLVPFTLVLFMAACQSESADSGDVVAATDAAAAMMADGRPNPLEPAGGEGNLPEGWIVRADRGETIVAADTTGNIRLVNMTPGWHVTSGPAAIYHHPANTAKDEYSVSSEIFLFDPSTRKEGFGLITGGTDLAGASQSYTYFLIRQGGQFLVKNRDGSETSTLVGWTDNDAIKSFVSNDEGPVANELEVNVEGDTVSFLANGELLTTVPRADVKTNGVVGLRINHGLNLHVSDLSISQ